MKGWVSLVGWPIVDDSHPSAAGRAQDRESSPVKDQRSAMVPRNQPAKKVTYMSQTCDQQRFTISEVAADWHEPVMMQHIMWSSVARANRQLDPTVQLADTPPPQSATLGLHPVAVVTTHFSSHWG